MLVEQLSEICNSTSQHRYTVLCIHIWWQRVMHWITSTQGSLPMKQFWLLDTSFHSQLGPNWLVWLSWSKQHRWEGNVTWHSLLIHRLTYKARRTLSLERQPTQAAKHYRLFPKHKQQAYPIPGPGLGPAGYLLACVKGPVWMVLIVNLLVSHYFMASFGGGPRGASS